MTLLLLVQSTDAFQAAKGRKKLGRAITRKIRNNKCWQGRGTKGTLVHYGSTSHCSDCGNSMEVIQKLKLEVPYALEDLLLGIYLKETKH